MSKKIDNNLIESISRVLGELTTGYKISEMFRVLKFYDSDTLNYQKPVSTKWRRLKETIIYECNKSKSEKPFFIIIEYIMQPQQFMTNVDSWHTNKKEINSHLIYYGCELNDSGKIIKIEPVSSMSAAQSRLVSFQDKLNNYDIHPIIYNFCEEELFQENYFHAILEASKSVMEHLREISELDSDGSELIQKSLQSKQPIVLIEGNFLNSKTDKSLYNGLKNLLETIVALYRNPTAHTPKLYDPTSETDAITAFTLMSLAHRLLDNCVNVRNI